MISYENEKGDREEVKCDLIGGWEGFEGGRRERIGKEMGKE